MAQTPPTRRAVCSNRRWSISENSDVETRLGNSHEETIVVVPIAVQSLVETSSVGYSVGMFGHHRGALPHRDFRNDCSINLAMSINNEHTTFYHCEVLNGFSPSL